MEIVEVLKDCRRLSILIIKIYQNKGIYLVKLYKGSKSFLGYTFTGSLYVDDDLWPTDIFTVYIMKQR